MKTITIAIFKSVPTINDELIEMCRVILEARKKHKPLTVKDSFHKYAATVKRQWDELSEKDQKTIFDMLRHEHTNWDELWVNAYTPYGIYCVYAYMELARIVPFMETAIRRVLNERLQGMVDPDNDFDDVLILPVKAGNELDMEWSDRRLEFMLNN